MAIDKKISELASGAPAQAADEYVVARGAANYKLTLTNIAASMPPIGATTPNTASFTTLTTSSTVTLNGGTANGVLYLNGSKVATSGTALVFDGSNLGLGVTPSAWGSGKKAMQLGVGAAYYGDTSTYSQNFSLANAYFDGTNFKYLGSDYATQYRQNLGVHSWWNAASGTAGNNITFTQAMTLASGGQLLVGTTSTVSEEVLSAAGSTAGWRIGSNRTAILGSGNAAGGFNYSGGNASSATAGVIYARVEAEVSSATASSESGALVLLTRNSGTLAERARITSGGELLVGATSALLSASGRGNVTINGSSSAVVALGVGGTRYGHFYADTTSAELSAVGGYLTFTAGSAERARITSAGNLAIGTTTAATKVQIFNGSYGNPATSGTTQANGALRLSASGTTGVLDFGIGAAGTNQWIQATDSGGLGSAYNLLLNPNGGNVGIGTTSPANKLSINQGSSSTAGLLISGTSSPQLLITETATPVTGQYVTDTSAAYLGTTTNHPLVLRTNTTERARITTGGQFIVNGTSASDGKIAAFKYNNVDDGAAIYGYQGNAAYPGVGTTRYGVRGACHGYSSVANVGVYGYSVDDSVSNTKLYGVWGETGEIVYNTGYGVYGKSVLYTGSSGTVYGVYGTVSTTQNNTTVGTTHAGYFYNASTKGGTAYGATVETVSGPGTVIPFRIIHAAAELLRVNSGGELLIGTGDNGAYLLQVNSQIWATNATIATSDSRLKDNVNPITNALDTINKVRAVTFDFKQDTKYNLDKERQTGFIAQELSDALDNADYKNCVVKECGDYYGVAYEKMIPVLVAAIQEQQAMIKSLEAKVAALESK